MLSSINTYLSKHQKNSWKQINNIKPSLNVRKIHGNITLWNEHPQLSIFRLSYLYWTKDFCVHKVDINVDINELYIYANNVADLFNFLDKLN